MPDKLEGMGEQEKWQAMMASCREACKILGEEFREPEYLNWTEGSPYHDALWGKVRAKKSRPYVESSPRMSLSAEHPSLMGELVRLSSDLEDATEMDIRAQEHAKHLETMFREAVESCLGFSIACSLGGVLENYVYLQTLGQTLIKNNPGTIADRLSKVENELKQALVKDLEESCDCKFFEFPPSGL